ncbi:MULTISPECIES: calcium-binding protein [unclassified Rhizobium]|uniref:calcium-binding protein n=1 Tax=unclassified Rhizobium TaxID=2613769 RepID=UPI0021F78460|nr:MULTISPECIES: calcium-binding protein [unclassified Rhizobium]MCV9942206.1 calcium-binding protein [Rhizobium sp. BT-175]MCW0015834.1 calcium-binding protein [Rhizobium sp. BT-226]
MLNLRVPRTALILGLGLILSIGIYDRTSRDSAQVVNNIVLKSDPDSNQRIHAGAGDDVVYGRGGQDEIRGDEGDDTLYGNEDDDLLTGGTGNDTYGYARGDGNDTILETIEDSGNADTLIFSDIGPGDIALRQEGDDLIVAIRMSAADAAKNASIIEEARLAAKSDGRLAGALERTVALMAAGGSILIKSGRSGGEKGIESIRFSDGTIWSKQDIAAHISVAQPEGIAGTSGGETVEGTMGDDLIIGLEGNDTLSGSFGDDTYVYASGHGSDVIDDIVNMSNEIDTLRLTDLTASDVMLLRDAAKLMVIVKPTGEVITVEKQFLAEGYWGIEKIEFSDGMSWDRDKILMR